MLREEVEHRLLRAIGRGVVENDDLEVLVLGKRNALECRANLRGVVVERNQHGDAGLGAGERRSSRNDADLGRILMPECYLVRGEPPVQLDLPDHEPLQDGIRTPAPLPQAPLALVEPVQPRIRPAPQVRAEPVAGFLPRALRNPTPRRPTSSWRASKAFRHRDQPGCGGPHRKLRAHVVVCREAHRRESGFVPQEMVREQGEVFERPGDQVLARDERLTVRRVLRDQHAPVGDPLEHAYPFEVRALLPMQIEKDLRRAQAFPLRLAEEKVGAFACLGLLRRNQQARAVRPERSREACERTQPALVDRAEMEHIDRAFVTFVPVPAIPVTAVTEPEVLGADTTTPELADGIRVDVDDGSGRSGVGSGELEPVRPGLLGAEGDRPPQLRARRMMRFANADVVLVRDEDVDARAIFGERVER